MQNTPSQNCRLTASHWNPYIVGFLIGVLSWAVFYFVNAPLGITTSLSQIAGSAATPMIGAEAVAKNSYWAKNAFAWDYGTLFLVGTFIGAFLAAITSGSFKIEHVPSVWSMNYGSSKLTRYAVSFIGGILVMYGARMAGGCTSGNGISGGLQLAVSGWMFMLFMFIGAVITAALVFKKS